ncbi:MAG: O-antigen ligase family protein [Lacibacter sp.]
MQPLRNHTNLVQFWLPVLGALALIVAGIAQEQPLLLALPFAALLLYAVLQVSLKELFFLLLFCIPLSTEREMGGSLSLDIPDEPLMLLLTGGLIGYFILQPRLFPKAALRSTLFTVLVLQLLWMLLAVVFSFNHLLSIKYLLAKIWYIVPFVLGSLLFLQQPVDFTRAVRLLTGALLLTVVVILVRHAAAGFTFESINFVLDPFYRNHVSYSAQIVLLFPVVTLAWQQSTGRLRNVLLLLLTVLLVALFFAYSRGAWLALLAGWFTWVALRRRLLLQLLWAAVIAATLGISWLIRDDNFMRFAPDHDKTFFRTDFREHMAATYELKDISTMERFYRWVAGVRMVKQEWLTGFGPNTFYGYYKNYAVSAFKTWVSDNPERSTVHNYFLLITIEQGIPALLLFLVLLYLMYQTAVRGYYQLQHRFDRMLAGLSAVLLSTILTLNLLSDLIETDKVGSFYFITLGLLIRTEYLLRTTEQTGTGA